MMDEKYEAVIIGSGFGGAITGCRLAKKWPGKVLILERGKHYPMGSFPRTPYDMAHNFWAVSLEKTRRPKHVSKMMEKTKQDFRGMFDVRNYKHMDVVIGAGLGGGSLIYANVFLIPPDEVFADKRWPQSCKKGILMPYYLVAKEVLGSRPIPLTGDPRRDVTKRKLFQHVARETKRQSELLDINVFFGNNYNWPPPGRTGDAVPLPIGHQEKNRYGALQTSCVYCAECIIGCNYHAKNTLDLNYLYVAKECYQADIRTEHLAEKIVPVDERNEEDPKADGSHGYRVYYWDLNRGSRGSILGKQVVVSAGTLGTTELLLRCKEYFGTLPRISDRLGHGFSGNGDFLSFVMGSKQPVNPNYGPTITQRIDHNLFQDFDRERAFLIEDAAYPTQLAWFVEGIKPGFLRFPAFKRFLKHLFGRLITGKSSGRVGFAFADLLSDDLSYKTAVLLCMGLDKADGIMKLDKNRHLTVDWPYKHSLSLYKAILNAGKEFRRVVGANVFTALPTWDRPFRNNITVHPLGGCILADDPLKGVTSADPHTFGQVFRDSGFYKGLYVADGAIVPTAVGANPSATISALSEMVAEGITGIKPDADLGV